jgi:hypothetical protein
MTNITTKLESQPAAETAVHLFDNWFDPIETGLSDRVREFIHAMIEGELDLALSRPRYARHTKLPSGVWCQRSSPRPPVAIAAGKLRPSGDRGAARQAEHPRW